MARVPHRLGWTCRTFLAGWAAWLAWSAVATGQVIVLRDGRTLQGDVASLPAVAEVIRQPPADGAPEGTPVVLVDDELRRYFVAKRQVVEFRNADLSDVEERFLLRQRTARGGGQVRSVDAIIEIAPFDEFGRRTFSMSDGRRRIDVIQGITKLTPSWCQVEGVNYVWDQRLATSTIPLETLDKILHQAIDETNVEQRLKIVRFYLQGERYFEAKRELEEVIAKFPDVRPQVEQQLQSLTQLSARRLLTEIRARRDAGQHRFVQQMLAQFPSEGVSGEILQAVRQLTEEYGNQGQRVERMLAALKQQLETLKDQPSADTMAQAVAEISAELSPATLDRLAPYEQFLGDEAMLPAEKLALALSGWVAGSAGATPNLPVALGQWQARELVMRYLTESTVVGRETLRAQLAEQEGTSVEAIARLIQFLKPPLAPLEPPSELPGLFRLTVAGLPDEPEIEYWVQVPPEYDPHRLYPTVVTLHGASTSTQQQIDWWAGAHDERLGQRLGQATRQGYIVIAPAWSAAAQRDYDYGLTAHTAVLSALRDATRHFAIDTDRVFLSGHGMGGDAAWDIGLAHPDLWAGVIPITALSDRYCHFYWPNGKYVPLYVVGGELDGDRSARNARDIDRYLSRGFPLTVAEFRGRGREHFSDEILRLFDWMQRYRRQFFPREFKCVTMRPWDNYFWWVELEDFPSKTQVLPEDWPPGRGARALTVEASVNAANNLSVRSGAERVRIWLSPQLLDFAEKTQLTVNGQRLTPAGGFIAPNLEVLLEDVRTRGDRQHAFWARFETQVGGKGAVGR